MKITGVRVTPYACTPARVPAGRLASNGCVIELETDAGLTGIAIGVDGARAQIELLVEGLLLGADPRGVTGIWRRMTDVQAARRREGLLNTSIAVLDVALWDLKAKANEEPLWKTLGGTRPRANAHAGGVALSSTDADLDTWYDSMARDHGLRGAKLPVGLDEDADIERLGLMRTALQRVTSDPVLIVDAQQGWSPKQAIRRLRDMEEEFDVAWAEDVTRSWDFPGLKQVSNAIRGAVCVGEDLATVGEFLPHFHHRSVDVIQIDIGAVGISGALELADAAYGFELPVTLCEAPGNIHAHLAGVMPYFMSLEVVDAVPAVPIYTTDVRIEEGWAVAGDTAGNGLVLNGAALQKLAKRTLK
ncbi:MAG TPA: enolase C-terminal domain-like protein [Steroidobacteraceae bacterium]|nr:enolase C-terminal domain-like protein [Steroidobacteraceae bacterium]